MNRSYHAIRRPVRRPRADTYLLITLLSFALSVSLTRLFLDLTGYPQLGGGTLHISHVMWGGLLLFIAAILPLILANRWVYWVIAILAGVGIGLFIDEVGKFITSSYDYFFPPAAPIVYAFFLLCVLIYLQISRPRPRQARAELYAALETLEDILDHDLDPQERTEIENRLIFVIEHGDPELVQLASQLIDYFKNDRVYLAPTPPYRLERLAEWLSELEVRYLDRGRLRTILVVGLGLLGLISIVTFPLISIRNQGLGVGTTGVVSQFWFIAFLLIQALPGLGLIFAAILLVTNREQAGIRIGYITLLIYLTMVNLFLFYYFQFSIIVVASIQFILLLAVLHYRGKYLDSEEFG